MIAEISTAATRNNAPLEAISLLRQMEPSDTQKRLLKDAAIVWGQADPHAASEWVGQVNDPDLQRNLISMIAIGYAYNCRSAQLTDDNVTG